MHGLLPNQELTVSASLANELRESACLPTLPRPLVLDLCHCTWMYWESKLRSLHLHVGCCSDWAIRPALNPYLNSEIPRFNPNSTLDQFPVTLVKSSASLIPFSTLWSEVSEKCGGDKRIKSVHWAQPCCQHQGGDQSTRIRSLPVVLGYALILTARSHGVYAAWMGRS